MSLGFFSPKQSQVALPPIVLPTLGRFVKLGYSVYNYNEDTVTLLSDLKTVIGPGSIYGPSTRSNSFKVELAFSTSKNLNNFKWKQLKLDSHLRSSILSGILAGPFWFSEFLTANSESGRIIAGKIFASIAVHVLARKSQKHKLSDQNLKAIMKEIGSRKDIKNISHVVSGLVYGFNVILTFDIEVSNLTEKEEVEACMYLEARREFSELTTSNNNYYCPANNHPISLLKKAEFQFYSDRIFPPVVTYEDILSYLKKAIINGQNPEDNVPIVMTLSSNKDSNPMRDLDSDTFNALQHHYAEKSAINEQIQLLTTDSLLIEIPYLKPRVLQFQKLVDEYFKDTSQSLLSRVKSFRKDNQTQSELIHVIEKCRLEMERISQWLFARHQELRVFRVLLKDVNINWTTDLERFIQDGFEDYVQVFFFKTQEHTETIAITDYQYKKELKSTVYAIMSASENARQKFREKLLKFLAKVQNKNCLAYLSPSTTCVNGSTLKINNQQHTSIMEEESITEHNGDSKFPTTTSNLHVENTQPAICSEPFQQPHKKLKETDSELVTNPKAITSNAEYLVASTDQHAHQTNETIKDEDLKVEHVEKSKVAPPSSMETKDKKQPANYPEPSPSYKDPNEINLQSGGISKAFTSNTKDVVDPQKQMEKTIKDKVSLTDRNDDHQVTTLTPNGGAENEETINTIQPISTQFSKGQNKTNSKNVSNFNDIKSDMTNLAKVQQRHQTKTEKSTSLTSNYQEVLEALELENSNQQSNDWRPSNKTTNNVKVDDSNDDADKILKTNPTANYADISASLNQAACPSIAKLFAERCQILEKGEPTIYMLEACEKESCNKSLRWFEIRTKPNSDEITNDQSRNHQVLILMGATGAGKSTLINGMINYMLGVEWDDPYRFKIVKDFKSGGANGKVVNQAHSQTSCVTAYTIHHVEGMKIPYDVTIIDTPGYGDTRGLEQDREITRKIEQFLIHPQTNKEFNYINAVCFVANSVESRFTPAQQYIFQSVTSIFGKDIRQNLRLLVTFSDGNKPPVLEAVRLAKIPGLSDNGGNSIEHHKFNSSALYAQNSCGGNVGSNENSFQKGFWNLGMQNFKLFFEILATMPDRSWEQTRQVIISREGIKKSLDKVRFLLGSYSEKIKLFQTLSLNLEELENKFAEAYQCLKQKKDSMKRRVVLDGKYFSYNCQKCEISCKKIPSSHDNQAFSDEQCTKCKCPASTHDPESYEWQFDEPDEDYKEKLKTYQTYKKSNDLAKEEKSKCKSELTDLREQMMTQFKSIETYSKHLKSSTLNNRPFTVVDYINSIISDLERKKQVDSSIQVKILTLLLKQYEDENTKSNNLSKPKGSSTTTV